MLDESILFSKKYLSPLNAEQDEGGTVEGLFFLFLIDGVVLL